MKLLVRDVEFAYDSTPVLDGVTLSLEAGELLGIVGPNGSGKSTLLRCLDGIVDPDDGAVFVDGTDLDDVSREELARAVGYVSQTDRRTFPSTVFETILLGRKPHINWRPSSADREAVAAVIDRLELDDYALRPIDELSGGQRRKVLIGRALVQEASVLVLDEPTSNLDIKHQLDVLEVVRARVDEGITAVMATHDLNLAMRYCDKLAMLADGEIVAAGGPETVTSDAIRSVYGVDATVTTHDGRRLVIPERPLSSNGDD